MAEDKILTYKGHPLMRKDNLIYYGSMADSHIVMLQVLEAAKGRLPVQTRTLGRTVAQPTEFPRVR